MVKLADFLLAAVSSLRLLEIISYEKIFIPVRMLFGLEYEDDNLISIPDTFWGKLFSCPRCLSIWSGGAIAALYFFFPKRLFYFLSWTLSLSWIGYMLDKTDLNM